MNLRLIGATKIKDITREVVDCSNLSSHVVAVPGDRLYDTNCSCIRFISLDQANLYLYISTDESMQIATLKAKL
jgi:L-lactate dehydrogenase (cytochrome)